MLPHASSDERSHRAGGRPRRRTLTIKKAGLDIASGFGDCEINFILNIRTHVRYVSRVIIILFTNV